jgi:hypothetical protein
LVVAGIIELLNRAAVSDVQLGGFTVTDLSVIRKVLPMVAAYLIYDITACSTRNIYSSRILGAINRTYRPALHKSRYAILAHPRGSSFFGPFSWHKSDTKTYKAIEMLVAVLRVGSMATPVVLLAYWFTLMFRAFGFEDPLVWLSAGVSGGFTALAVLVVIEGIRSNLISPSWTSLISVHRRDALDERAWRVGPLP